MSGSTSWTVVVKCKRCGTKGDWSVKAGVWTCACGQPMHHPLDRSKSCEICPACHPDYPCDVDCHICWPIGGVR